MKSSKTIQLSILAASIAGCNSPQHNHPVVTSSGDWDDTTSGDYYINDGYGYSRSFYYHPFYVGYYPYYINGHVSCRTSVVYHTSKGYCATSGGRISHVSTSHGMIGHSSYTSRGGFGSTGHGFGGHSGS
jgi:hypothetical protein